MRRNWTVPHWQLCPQSALCALLIGLVLLLKKDLVLVLVPFCLAEVLPYCGIAFNIPEIRIFCIFFIWMQFQLFKAVILLLVSPHCAVQLLSLLLLVLLLLTGRPALAH